MAPEKPHILTNFSHILPRTPTSSGTGTATADEGGGREASADARYSYPCRCGDRYELDAEDLHADFEFVDVPCASCSLFTRVRYGPADE